MLVKIIFALLLICEAQCFKYYNTYIEHHDLGNAEEMFKEFLEATDMNFVGDKYYERLAVFTDNLKYVNEMNARNGSARFGVTMWSHLTKEEFIETIRCLPQGPPPTSATGNTEFITKLTDDFDKDVDVDWRDKLLPAKNQQHCGNCWIFSAVAAIESHHAIENDELLSLSEQQVQDCTKGLCAEGGWPHEAFQYVKTFGGIMKDEDYPYIAADQVCSPDRTKIAARLIDFDDLPDSETVLRQFVEGHGPISIGINAILMHSYINGILDPEPNDCGDKLDHAVLIVGSINDEKPHWVIRNSWGPTWGENGYFRIVRNKRACGIGAYARYPRVAPNSA